jgi:hypothetical protein
MFDLVIRSDCAVTPAGADAFDIAIAGGGLPPSRPAPALRGKESCAERAAALRGEPFDKAQKMSNHERLGFILLLTHSVNASF